MSTEVGFPGIPVKGMVKTTDNQRRVVRMACSLLLVYPDAPASSRTADGSAADGTAAGGEQSFADKLAAVRMELDGLPAAIAEEFTAFCDAADQMGLRALQEHYVETFDQRRRCALSLTYFTHGDTRGRGQALLAFREALREAGFDQAREELPDYLPVVLELCALDETGTGEGLLSVNREGIEVIRTALRSAHSPYAHLLEALIRTMPEADEKTLAAYQALIEQGPPTELVGVGNLDAVPSPFSGTQAGIPNQFSGAQAAGGPSPTTSASAH